MSKKDVYYYPAVFTYEPGEEIAVVFPDLNVATSGKNDADAMVSAKELLGITLFGLEEDGENIAEPTALRDVKEEGNERTVLVEVPAPGEAVQASFAKSL